MEEYTYTRQDILDLIERIAESFDVEWNGDSDTFEEASTFKACAEIVRDFKEEYEW